MQDRRKKGIIINQGDKTIRGSFINVLFTASLIGLIIAGAFYKPIADNLHSMETLIIGVYAVSFGVYQIRKVAESRKNGWNTQTPME